MITENDDKTAQNWIKEAQKGYIRMGILILLNKKPSHGYEIMKEFKNRTRGFMQPTAGGVYPILRDLEQSGYIKGQWQSQKNRRLKVYRITASGDAILKRAIIKQNEITNNISNLFQEFARDVLNVDVAKTPISTMPSMFSSFLADKENSEETLQKLEAQQKHLKDSISTTRRQLNKLNKRIDEIRRHAPDSAPHDTE
jgi:PadR family transcriptional regulator, regulatory protein PadR